MLTTLIYRSQVHPDRPPVDLDALVHRASSKKFAPWHHRHSAV
ncbi:Diguanylate cyclase/phosphodiesterase domain 2 (EAL) [Klebsiella pneumoniae ISC21]|nr:Diguanylate cyclase/phosphodiesterase domain 2 (EAL) [Klebsiella pneumoniae ISC21]